MNQHNDYQQTDHHPEKVIERARQLKENLQYVDRTVDDLLQAYDSLREQAKKLEDDLLKMQEALEASQKACEKAENNGREWKRRVDTAKEEIDNTRNKVIQQALEKLGKSRLLSNLESLLKKQMDVVETQDQNRGNDGPTLRTVSSSLQKWIENFSQSRLTRIFESEDATVHRDETINLIEFQPSNPFSEEFPRARCRVISSGWRVGTVILEKAILEPLECLPAEPMMEEIAAAVEYDEQHDESVSESTTAENSEPDVESLNVDIAPLDELSDEHTSISNETDDPFPIDLLHEVTRIMKEENFFVLKRENLWNNFINAVFSGNKLDSENRKNLRYWMGAKKSKVPAYQTIVSALEDRPDVLKTFAHYWSKLVTPSQDE